MVKLHELNDYERGLSVNVGLIDGGISSNTVATDAEAQVDVRVKNMEQAKKITTDLLTRTIERLSKVE